MKTIAISIDEAALQRLDHVAPSRRGKRRNRSAMIRRAVEEFIARLERRALEERDAEIIRRHHRTLNRQAAALIREQAKL